MDLDAQQVAALVEWREAMMALTRTLATLAVLDGPCEGGSSIASPAAVAAMEEWLESNWAPAAVKRIILSQANLTATVFHSLFNLAEARGARWNPGDREVVWSALMVQDAEVVETKHREARDHAPPRTE